MINQRQKANLEIIKELTKAIYSWPDGRFHQILYSLGVTTPVGKDKFNEESVETLRQLEEVMKKFKFE